MKKQLLIIVFIAIVSVVLGILVQNNIQPEKETFAEQIEKANGLCPISTALGKGAVTSITLEDGYVVYKITYDRDFCHIMQLLSEDKHKEVIAMAFFINDGQGEKSGTQFINMLIKEDCGLKCVIEGSSMGPFECSVSVNELISIRKKFTLSPHEALHNTLSLIMEAERANLPLFIDEGMAMTDYLIEDNNIVIVVTIDEELYDLDAYNLYKEYFKTSIFEDVKSDAQFYALLSLFKVSHSGLVYRIVGMQSQEKCDIIITSDEIRKNIETPPNLNIK